MNSGKRRRWLPSPAMVIALFALVSGLAGTAVALQGKNTVKSNDIAPKAVKGTDIASNAISGKKIRKDAVKGSKIKNGSVAAPDLNVFRSDGEAGVVTTTSGPDVDLGGPRVTVTVPPGGLVGIYARAEGQATGGGADGAAQVHLYEPAFLPDAPRIMSVPNNAGFQFRFTAPGSGDLDGVASATRGGMIVLAPPAGTYTFSLRYSQAGGAEASFRNRTIWAGVLN